MAGRAALDGLVVVLRVDPQMYAFLRKDAADNRRTVAQTIRFILNRAMMDRAD